MKWLLLFLILLTSCTTIVNKEKPVNECVNITIEHNNTKVVTPRVIRINDSNSPGIMVDCEYAIGNNLTITLYGYDEILLNMAETCKFLYQAHYEGGLK
jgi:hypothetical protein